MNLPALWLCADLGAAAEDELCDRVSRVLALTPCVVWLRSPPDASARALLSAAHALREVSRGRGALFVGDRVDVAVLSGADGVHLTERSLDPRAVRAISALARSAAVHDAQRLLAVREHVDVLLVSPFRALDGKGEPLGIDGLRALRAMAPDRIVVALGGITTPEDARSAKAAGADGVAVRRRLLEGDEPEVACAAIARACSERQSP